MAIIDWSFTPIPSFEREFDRLRRQMDDAFGRMRMGIGAGFPAMNVYDQGEDVLVAIQAPGVRKDDLAIDLRENTLTVTGKRQAPDYENAAVLRDESDYGEFKRSLRIQTRVQQDKVEADYKNGILLVRMPKAEEAKPKQIAIKA